jgi:hypothetical protein
VPFGFGKRDGRAGEAAQAGAATVTTATALTAAALAPHPAAAGGIAFDGVTEEWRLVGVMEVEGRLSDALNKRDAISIRDVSWAPLDGSEPFSAVPGLRLIDPYDLIVVLAGEDSLPDFSDEEKAAHRVHKVSYGVILEVPPFRVRGTVHVFPGYEPERLLDRSSDMFFAVTDGLVMLNETRIGDTPTDTILVNRHYLRRVEQLEGSGTEETAPG